MRLWAIWASLQNHIKHINPKTNQEQSINYTIKVNIFIMKKKIYDYAC